MGRALITPRGFGKGEILECYYGLVVFVALNRVRYRMMTHVKIVMQVTMQAFLKWEKMVPKVVPQDIIDKYKVYQKLYIVPAPFYAMQYVNLAR